MGICLVLLQPRWNRLYQLFEGFFLYFFLNSAHYFFSCKNNSFPFIRLKEPQTQVRFNTEQRSISLRGLGFFFSLNQSV